MNEIKRGVSLYSYQEEYYLRKMSLEDCIATSAGFGAFGVETLAEQMMPGFPHLSDDFYAQWHDWMKQYGTTPVCHDMFLDTKRYKGRLLTDDEMLESVKRDIKHASRLGCSSIRILVITPPHIMERAAPYAEKAGVRLLLEVHSPWTFTTDWIVQHIEVMNRIPSGVLGLIPDLGIFVERFPQVIIDRFLRDGAHPALVEKTVETYNNHGDTASLPEWVEKHGGNQQDVNLARTVGHYVSEDPKKMLAYMPLIHHVHGKFYSMTEDYTEPSIPYEEIIKVLFQGGYSGYISSEYEGNRHIQDAFTVDSVEQVRRHQVMMQRLIEKFQ